MKCNSFSNCRNTYLLNNTMFGPFLAKMTNKLKKVKEVKSRKSVLVELVQEPQEPSPLPQKNPGPIVMMQILKKKQ